jgi:hypothetical protein
MNLFTNIAAALNEKFNEKMANKMLSKENIENLLTDNIELHANTAKILGTLSDKDINKLYNDTVKVALKKSDSPLKDVYDTFVSKLKGTAQIAERKRFFGALQAANEAYAKALGKIVDEIDTIFDKDETEIHSARLSQLAVMGVLKSSDTLVSFTVYLYAFLTRVAVDNGEGIPKYRQVAITDNVETVAKTVNDILDKKGIEKLVGDIKYAKSKGLDVKVASFSEQFDFDRNITTMGFGQTFMDCLANVLHCLNIFVHISNMIDDYRLKKNKRNREIKEWLEQHVAILRLEVANKDKNDPEYARLIKIIKAYDEEIAEYEQAINEFEKDE